jgi:hypothetical protein
LTNLLEKPCGSLLKKEYILLLDLNFYKIPIQSDGHGFDRVLLDIYPPGGYYC